jgi:hypothetical protein
LRWSWFPFHVKNVNFSIGFYVKTKSSTGSHIGYTINTEVTTIEKYLAMIRFHMLKLLLWWRYIKYDSIRSFYDLLQSCLIGGCCGRDCMVVGLLLPKQSVPITTIVVSSNPAQVRYTRYNIKWRSLSVTCNRWLVFSGFLHQ